jgi:hypothetical protein
MSGSIVITHQAKAMATDLRCELEEFHRYLGRELERGNGVLTIEQAVVEFRAYQEELQRCREAIRPALEASLRGESEPLDMEAIWREVERRLTQQGVPE